MLAVSSDLYGEDMTRVQANRMAEVRLLSQTVTSKVSTQVCTRHVREPLRSATIAIVARLRAKREQLQTFQGLSPESQGQNLALTVFYVPYICALYVPFICMCAIYAPFIFMCHLYVPSTAAGKAGVHRVGAPRGDIARPPKTTI